MPGALYASACPGKGKPALPTCLNLNAFLKGGTNFDSKKQVRSGARSLQPDYSDSAHVFFTPVSGVGGGCLRVSLPCVCEQEETSGSLGSPGECPSLPQVYCLPGGAESQAPLPLSPSGLGSHHVLGPLYVKIVIRGCDILARVN